MNGLMDIEIKEAKLFSKGKVRKIYDLDDKLLIVTTDKLSAFDVVLPKPIPDKGRVLTQISNFWFNYLKENNIVNNHIIETDLEKIGEPFSKYKELKDRTILVKKAERIDIECIVRGYIEGSGLKEYNQTGKISGIELPKGLKRADKLENPIFTPSTKADSGHDENITFQQMVDIVGEEIANKLKDLSIKIYSTARDYALTKGIIIADTKFEFGIVDNEIILIDEVLTPDSSRFWPLDEYKPGQAQRSFDKQYVRDYLETLDWDKTYPGPEIPDNIIKKTREKYIEAFERLTDQKFN